MDNELRIYCTNIGEYVDVEGGETLQHVYERIKDRIKIRPISVMVNTAISISPIRCMALSMWNLSTAPPYRVAAPTLARWS